MGTDTGCINLTDASRVSKTSFGEAVRARRTDLGLTQEDVFMAGGPSVATIRNIENGTADCRPRTIRRLIETLDAVSSANKATTTGKKFGASVRMLRESRNWSQEQMAKRLLDFGVALHQTSVSKIEKGTRPVTIDEAVALASALDVALALLLPKQNEGWRALAETAAAAVGATLPGAVGQAAEQLLQHYVLTADREDERMSGLARAVVQQAGELA